MSLTLAHKPLIWYNRLKYLGVHMISGKNFKIDITSAKLKYYGCFNSIISVTGKRQNEIVCFNILSTYCLSKLIYSCEIMSCSNVNIHDLDIVWNNAFRHIFNCCWRESVRPLQYIIDEWRLIFMRKLFYHDSLVLRMLASLLVVYCSQYAIKDLLCSRRYIRESVQNAFCHRVF